MSQVVDAIFQNGVFKPLHPVDIKESEVVAIKVVSIDEWQTKFSALIKKIHRKTAPYSAEEIEEDISEALKEARKERNGA